MYEIIPLESPADITQAVPGSKSITNRILLIAALADGKSEIKGALSSDDTEYMKKAITKLGIKIEEKKNGDLIVYGKRGSFLDGDIDLFLGNAGTSTRFLTATMVLRNGKTVITGNKRMRERPIDDLIEALKQLGIDIKSQKNNDCPPVKIIGKGFMPGGSTEMKGNKSSQYFSALLLTAPLARDSVTINVIGNLVSKPYIDITIRNMKNFGVDVINESYKKFVVRPQKYRSREYYIEGDASSASYFFALAALTNSTVTITNVSYDSPQGDIHIVDRLEQMGCLVRKNEDMTVTVQGPKMLKALGEIPVGNMPDAAMTMAIICTCAQGKTVLRGLENLKIKETDRLHALATELNKLGIVIKELKDGLEIEGSPFGIEPAEIETYDDHRMAMCFAILGTKFPGITIKTPECVNKTYPDFWKDLEGNGVRIVEK